MSIEKVNIEMTKGFEKTISDAINSMVSEEFDKAIKTIEKRKNEIVAGVLLNIQKSISMDQSRDTVTFTIREITK